MRNSNLFFSLVLLLAAGSMYSIPRPSTKSGLSEKQQLRHCGLSEYSKPAEIREYVRRVRGERKIEYDGGVIFCGLSPAPLFCGVPGVVGTLAMCLVGGILCCNSGACDDGVEEALKRLEGYADSKD